MAIKVSLRKKIISGGKISLYLDYYPPITNPKTGEKTRREFLGYYIFEKPKNPIEKQHNKDTILIAEQIRNIRDNDTNKPEIYSGFEKEQLRLKELGERDFLSYFKSLVDKRKSSNHDNWISAYHYLNTFTNGSIKFCDVNQRFCNEFKEYLLTTKSKKSAKVSLSQNSALSYFNKLKASLKQAFKDGYIPIDINSKVETIKPVETHRSFLSLEELNILVKTNCQNPDLKTMALFSALTGLRYSDIRKMTWEEIEFIEGNGYFIKFKQQKTQGIEMMPISEQAFQLLGHLKGSTGIIFSSVKYSAHQNAHLSNWIKSAGITKHITFHCFRHTYATIQLSKGTDLYTVSKMLGHRDLKTTQIYAQIIDQTKRDASNKIILDL